AGASELATQVADAENPPREAFENVLNSAGVRIFGLIMWAAAISSVIGASYTSVSFLVSFHPWIMRNRNWLVVAFIALSTAIYLAAGQTPVTLLILAGALNGLILPFGLGFLMWVAGRRRDLLGGYRYPIWLLALGVAAWVLSLYLGYNSLTGIADLWE
ncbi:divalent metal cation transporter, partial [Actinomadura adrarensis]